MSTPQEPEAKPAARRGMAFRKNSRTALPTPEQSRRQASVLQSAWRHFGEPGPVIAFLNARHAVLEGQPLHLAVESDDGLVRVEALLNEMAKKAQRVRRKRPPESDAERSHRLTQDELSRIENSAAEERALDAAVRRSIGLHGA